MRKTEAKLHIVSRVNDHYSVCGICLANFYTLDAYNRYEIPKKSGIIPPVSYKDMWSLAGYDCCYRCLSKYFNKKMLRYPREKIVYHLLATDSASVPYCGKTNPEKLLKPGEETPEDRRVCIQCLKMKGIWEAKLKNSGEVQLNMDDLVEAIMPAWEARKPEEYPDDPRGIAERSLYELRAEVRDLKNKLSKAEKAIEACKWVLVSLNGQEEA